jgi:Domain of unknown function (DUF4296)
LNFKYHILSLLLILPLAFIACKRNGGHLPPKEMKMVLLDVHLAEAYCTMVKDTMHKAGGTRNIDSLKVYYKRVLDHHKLTTQQFNESLDWYKAHPTELDSMYADMLNNVYVWQQRAATKR